MAGSSAASVAIRSSWRAVRSSSIGIAGLHGRVGMEQPGEPLAHPGHSLSRMRNQAVSRLRPLTM